MINLKITFSAFLFLVLTHSGICQNRSYPWYVITYQDDTLHGYIDLRSNYLNSQSCKFFEQRDQNSVIYSPDDIKAYKLDNGKYYISGVINIDELSKKVFLEYLVDGIVDLYYLKDFQSHYYFIQNDTSLVRLSNDERHYKDEATGKDYLVASNQYKKVLKYLLSDSESTTQKLTNIRFDYKSLINIAVDYHNDVCTEYECINYSRLSKSNIVTEINAGMVNSWMGLKTSPDYATANFSFIGCNVRITSPRIFEQWNLLLGLKYYRNKFYDHFRNELYTGSLKTYEIFSKYDIITIPLAFEYTFPAKTIKPFLSGGFNNIFILDADHYVNIVTSTGAKGGVESDFRKNHIGLTGGLGLKYEFRNKNLLYFKSEFEYRKPLVNYRYVLDYHYVYSLFFSMGYGISL